MDSLILVNKENSIDINYIPEDLKQCEVDLEAYKQYKASIVREACIKYYKMRRDALLYNYDIYVCSGFRSGEEQQKVFNYYLRKNKEKLLKENPIIDLNMLEQEAYNLTAKRVALPGQSEHQTGLAIDIECYYKRNYDEDIAELGEIEWMKENAHKYGYILRYPKGKEDITGYNFEPWHYRYIGEEYAYDYSKRNMTFEEYHKLVLKK